MDFGGFILFGLLAAGLIVVFLFIAASVIAPPLRRWTKAAACLGCLLALLSMFMGRYLYQVYWLDERLFIAAANGETARVESLLSSGANPSATWEDGTSALEAARSANHREVVRLLTQAGAAN